MSLIHASPAEIARIQSAMEGGRGEIMKHAHQIAFQAGFQKADEHAMASLMLMILAAQRYALQSRQHYGIFKALCADMAASEADSVVTRALLDLGPEATGLN